MLSLAQTIKDIRAKLSAKADKTYVDSLRGVFCILGEYVVWFVRDYKQLRIFWGGIQFGNQENIHSKEDRS